MKTIKSKNIIIAVLCGFMVLMGVGYAMLSQTLTINSTAGISSTWDIEITNINVINTKGYAENDEQGTSIAADKVNANLSAKFQAPGDSITYEIEVSNLGTIAGKIENIVVNQVGENQDIIIASTDTSNGTLEYLAPTTGKGTFNVTLTFNENVTELPTSSTGKYQVKKMANEGVSYNFIVQPSFVQTGINQNVAEDNTDNVIEDSWYYGPGSGISYGIHILNNKVDTQIMYTSNGNGRYIFTPEKIEKDENKEYYVLTDYSENLIYDSNETGIEPQEGDLIWLLPFVDANQNNIIGVAGIIRGDDFYYVPNYLSPSVKNLTLDSTFTPDKYGNIIG